MARTMPTALLAALLLFPSAAFAVDICSGAKARTGTCIIDGDSGWNDGARWRLIDIDAPSLGGKTCKAEAARARTARDRLAALMSGGYEIRWKGGFDVRGSRLVDIQMADGRNAGTVLMHENLAQEWPTTGNIWCGR